MATEVPLKVISYSWPNSEYSITRVLLQEAKVGPLGCHCTEAIQVGS